MKNTVLLIISADDRWIERAVKNKKEDQKIAHIYLNSWKYLTQMKHTTVPTPDQTYAGLNYSTEQ